MNNNMVEQIGKPDCIFKVLPQNIGELQHIRTTNAKAERDPKEKRNKQLLLSIGIPLATVGIVIGLFPRSTAFIIIVSIIALIVIIKRVKKIVNFKGVDYFVGTEGFAKLTFDGDRADAKVEYEERFEKYADFISKEVDHYRNNVYEGTEIVKRFFSEVNENGQCTVLGDWTGTIQKSSEEYHFFKDIESAWSVYHLARLREKFLTGNAVSFNLYSEDNFCPDYLTFKEGVLKVGDRIYDKTTLKDVRIGNGVLIIEHVNHSTKLFGLIKKGDQEEIPFSMIANSKVFMLFFEDFVARTK